MISAAEARKLQCATADRPCAGDRCMAWASEVKEVTTVQRVPVEIWSGHWELQNVPTTVQEPTGGGYCLMIPNPHKE